MRVSLTGCLATFVAACVLYTTACAAEVSAADARGVKTAVQGQLAAFAADDARKAYSFAAPSIQAMFGSPDRFMAMVRAQYPMVHRAAAVSFFQPQAEGDAVVQRVQVTDAAGRAWVATYLVQRQKDKSWRIGGCVVAPAQPRLST